MVIFINKIPVKSEFEKTIERIYRKIPIYVPNSQSVLSSKHFIDYNFCGIYPDIVKTNLDNVIEQALSDYSYAEITYTDIDSQWKQYLLDKEKR